MDNRPPIIETKNYRKPKRKKKKIVIAVASAISVLALTVARFHYFARKYYENRRKRILRLRKPYGRLL